MKFPETDIEFAMRDEIDALKAKLEAAERRNGILAADNNEVSKQALSLRAKLKAAEREIVRLKKGWKRDADDTFTLRARISALEAENAKLQEKLESYQKVGGAAGQVMQSYLNRIAALEAENAKLRVQLKAAAEAGIDGWKIARAALAQKDEGK